MLRQFSRKNEKSDGTLLPEKWVEKLSELMQDTFPELQSFKALYWGQYFKDELLLITSIYNEQESKIPYTIILSLDITTDKESQIKKTLDNSAKALGVIIEDYLAKPTELEYIPSWAEHKFDQTTCFYTISREDILLTLEANKLYDL